MTPRLQRASLLIDQGRYELAERELTAAMAEEPNDAVTHGLMAICMLSRERFDEATDFAERAIHLAPDSPMGYGVAAIVWRTRRHFDKAEASIREAIALLPYDADYRATLSSIKYLQKDWEAAREAAEAALAIDPEHTDALNLRAESLRKLGRTGDALAELETSLQVNPDSAGTHASLGWTYLQKGNRAKATEHFREALRLDPELEWAREGVLETLRSYNPLYRPLMAFFFWMQSLTGRAQWGVILGAYVVYQIIRAVARANPAWAPFLTPLIFIYIAFVAATWIGKPLMNLTLRLHPLGRLALSHDERIASNWIGGFLAAGLAALAATWFYSDAFLPSAIALLLMVIPLAAMFNVHEPRLRMPMMIYTILVGACGVLYVLGNALVPDVANAPLGPRLLGIAGGLGFLGLLLGAFVAPFACNIIATVNWKR
jgi:tetratricopeptide (TPR) repeat protein